MAVHTRFTIPIAKDKATMIVASMRDAIDVETQRMSVEQAVEVVNYTVNRPRMVEVGILPVLAMALEEWEDQDAICFVAFVVGSLAYSVDEDEKIQFLELIVSHIKSDFTLNNDISMEKVLMRALYNLTDNDSIARQRLRDIPTFMKKMNALERVMSTNVYFYRFLNDMRSLTPSGTMTKAARA